MVDLLYKLYSIFCNDSNILEKTKINSIFRHIIQKCANILVPFWYKKTTNNPHFRINPTLKTEGRIIASLTTFPARIDNIWIVIESILRQSQKPDMLVLWLSKEQFPSIDVLPNRLKALQNRGLQIRLCDDDLRSHKKYYYVLRDYPHDHLFTFDDDLIYPTNTISSVMSASTIYPDCIIGRYSNQVELDKTGNVHFTRNRKRDIAFQPSWTTFIGSGGGTLFPAGFLPEIAKDKNTFMAICKTADDVWLNTMCRFSGHKVIAIMNKCPLLEIINKNNSTLTSINAGYENYQQQMAVREFCIANGKDPFEPLINNKYGIIE